ncbi:hypothetical protein PaecuDRAFT_4737 [Paenibacillus curdlanolyticus YK9]|uniref:Uncharacterized protein n=1 Tax=Paenibacillus curdlanolyticus YK9 TaxID=717606 RepID=E0IGE4_9BACL|nr:hypothetical protein [Paenibacillus curdlanolyticus]EFM08444.1 hypothetical protein PaecuDRAFT_4737 [Paenibacillus curdlanolyticus YK9]
MVIMIVGCGSQDPADNDLRAAEQPIVEETSASSEVVANESAEPKEQEIAETDAVTVNYAAQYNGQWVTLIKPERCGTCKNTLNIEIDSANQATVSIQQASDHGTHLAGIDFTVQLDGQGSGAFTFDEDGWFHQGKGTISLQSDVIEVTITEMKDNPDADEVSNTYNIFSGTQQFYRPEVNRRAIMAKLMEDTDIDALEFKYEDEKGYWYYCAVIDPNSEGEPLCYGIDPYSGKYFDDISGGYEGNIYSDHSVPDFDEVAAFVKQKLNLEGDTQFNGSDYGLYIVQVGEQEFEYDSDTGDLFDSKTHKLLDGIGLIEPTQ